MTSTKLLIKRSIKSAASVAPVKTGFASPTPDSVNIIAYHRVVADIAKAERESIYGLVVSTDTFWRHCEMLKKAYDVVSLETARYFLCGKRRVGRPLAVITFDDGYLDFYEEAFPILNEFGLPATVFLPTDFIGKNKVLAHDRIFWLLKQAIGKSISIANALQRAGIGQLVGQFAASRNLLKLTDSVVFLPNEQREKVISELETELGDKFENYPREYQLLDWEMVREMHHKGINFGAHTANHVVLTCETEAAFETEIVGCKKELERQLSSKVVSFAYPNGAYNPRVRQIIAQAGYEVAVTTETKINQPGADLFALGRISLCEESTRGLSGTYSAKVAGLRLGV
ncbi:MAG: polysaccharide deacetylase family protein [Acidobacteriota bacterium]|nr:polysaccharide deacetylase family protein [Acidobacteriota bacterium]